MQIKWLFDHGQANDGGHVFIISVNGVHCLINEPCKKPSAKWYSHKFNKPGLPCIRDCSFSLFKQGHMGARSFSHTSKDQTRACEYLAAFLHDTQIPHPQVAAAAASAAYPHWQDSEAETLLKNDIAAGIGTTIKPKQLWNLRKEYQAFPLTVFRKHIHQELCVELDTGYWLNKKKEKEEKKKNKQQKKKTQKSMNNHNDNK
jgi:hypothetical protein